MKRNVLVSVLGLVGITVALLIWSIIESNSVQLGLDLKGGTEVVLEPVDDTELEGVELEEALDQSVEILRRRVDGIGVAEPDITRQGERLVVQLAGVEDQQRALELVGKTAELRFRPVCSVLPLAPVDVDDSAGPVDPDDRDGDGVRDIPFGISPFDADAEPIDDEVLAEQEVADAEAAAQAEERGDTLTTGVGVGCENVDQIAAFSAATTTRESDEAELPVIFEQDDPVTGEPVSRLLLGRTMLTGASLEDADASFDGFEWAVLPTFKAGAEGIDLFNNAAGECFTRSLACPSQQLGIVLDGEIISAPTVQTAAFDRSAVRISGSFTQEDAENTALSLRFGALPLEFGDPTDPDSGSRVRLVSATLGQDSFDAGVVAGIVGLAFVALYMIAYYRLLGVAAMLSLAVSGTLLWIILAWQSATQGLVLTLAGVVGLIVSIGTSLDSNVVYFEHLKEDIANGRTLRSSVDRSFPVAFKTIFWANLASLIGAAILWFLTIGSVRGFAFMLGLASILDLIATYFFLRPLVRIMAQGRTLLEKPNWFGLPRPGAPVESS